MYEIARGAAVRRPPETASSMSEEEQPLRVVGAAAVGLTVILVAMFLLPIGGPAGLLVAIGGAALVALLLGSPLAGFAALAVTSFLRQALQGTGLPAEPMVLVLVSLVVTTTVATVRRRIDLHLGPLEFAMLAYVTWNVISMIAPHELPAMVPLTNEPISVYRFILTGTVMPFLSYVVARALMRTPGRVRGMLFGLAGVAAYSAIVSIMQFSGPKNLVWPPYIISAPSYPERAVGVVNQPVVNGVILVAGFVTATYLAQQKSLRPRLRMLMLLTAVLCIPAIYLTKTRAVWLVFGLSIAVGALAWRGSRRGFVVVLAAAAVFIGANWATFTSSNREAGGVASSNEVEDRLNSMATAFWGIDQKPLLGWGIARFAEVNAHHHKQWEPSSTFQRGYGIASHENELGIATELGIVGLTLWLAVLVLLLVALLKAMIRLPRDGLAGRGLGWLALTALLTWLVTGFTADLRYFDFANLLTFALIGATVGSAVAADKARPVSAARKSGPSTPAETERLKRIPVMSVSSEALR